MRFAIRPFIFLCVALLAPACSKPAAVERELVSTTSQALTAGLNGTYYTGPNFTGGTVARVDGTINFDWMAGSPIAGVGTDGFSVRWTGQILAPATGTFTFETETDDGVRLWVDNTQLVNSWADQVATKLTGTISLTSGVYYDIKMEYYDNTGPASAKLRWSGPATAYAVVPAGNLFQGCPNKCTVGATGYCAGVTHPSLCAVCAKVAGSYTWSPYASSTVCRAAAGVCDNAENCDGTTVACPADTKLAAGTVCRASAGTCDPAETCSGAANTCPADVLSSAATVCRASAGTCDVVENCTGASAACPADVVLSSASTCRAAAGTCDVAETCTGLSGVCPADTLLSSATVCRGSAGVCDVAENCTGAAAACPADAKQVSGTVCRASAGTCDTAEACNGVAATCPADAFVSSATVCRASAGTCDPAENCPGNAAACPANAFSLSSVVCRASAGVCDVVENCTGSTATCPSDAFLSSVTTCRASGGVCDAVELCTGSAAACPADVKQPAGTVCRAVAGVCDSAETCSGAANTCPADTYLANTTVCRASAGVCDVVENCPGTGINCPVDAVAASSVVCRASAGVCDVVEKCTGSAIACPTDAFALSTVTCRASAGVCDVLEKCTGSAAACPGDSFLSSATVCRAAATVCDVAENCTGSVATCPSDTYVANGVACTDDNDDCTADYCGGASTTCGHAAIAGCTHGLTGRYYDNSDFTGTSVTRVDSTINFNFGAVAPVAGIAINTYSVRWTGQIQIIATGTYTFETQTDDGARLWVNDTMLVNKWTTNGKFSGTINLTAGNKYDIKMDYYQGAGGASAYLRWTGPGIAYAIIPAARLFPTGDSGTAGFDYVNASGDNPAGWDYGVWRVSDVAGTAPVDATAESANNWGLGHSVMMVPSFAPDASKLVFIDGDTAGGAGWRKGLSLFDFDQNAKTFSNRRILRNTFPSGDVMKWPVFESDSRSIVFQTSTPAETCLSCSTQYGQMAPTNYYQAPGTLWSIDSSGGAAVQLSNLNTGERAADLNKAYQPTILPTSAGGYRWAVFTSTRPYGNALNDPGTATNCLASQLWVAAIDDATSGATDRSHPAFWLPNQNIGRPSTNSYINERAYWVLNQCVAPGAVCSTDEDCCGSTASPPTGACRIDQPATSPPTLHCAGINSSACVGDGASCAADSDCCAFPVSHCITGACTPPAPLPSFTAGAFTRDYTGDCPQATLPVWRFLDWQTVTPGDSSVVFSAQTADSIAELSAARSVIVGTAAGAPITTWTGADVGALLPNIDSRKYLRVTATLHPTSDSFGTPVLTNWRQSYSCVPAQ